MPFAEIVSSIAIPSWHSLAAQRWSHRFSDIGFLRRLYPRPLGFDGVDFAWLGSMCDISHKLAFRLKSAENQQVWFFALEHFEHSAVLCWPGTLKRVGGVFSACFWEPDLGIEKPVLEAIVDLEDVEAVSLEWRSPSWQYHNALEFYRSHAKECRLFVQQGPHDLATIVAQSAFWTLGATWLSKLADHVGVDVGPDSSNLCSVVFALVQKYTGLSDEATMDIVAQRFAYNDASSVCQAQMMELDAAIDVMDARDVKKFEEAKDTIQREKKAHEDFRQQYQERRQNIQRAKSGGKGQGKKKDKLPCSIEQTAANKYMPPGGSVWRGLTKATWNAHVPPRKRISEPWGMSEQGSLRRLLYRAWEQHLELKSLGWDSCPWDFDEAVAEAVAASSS